MVSVIASFMQVESHKAWKRAAKKICKRKDRSVVNQRRVLYTLPRISVDSLPDVLSECLLDLGLFPAGIKICADALLDIWVYVEKLQKAHALAILSELANRKLLNLIGNPRGNTSIAHRNTTELYISQCDVMRDLVLHLEHQEIVVHHNRLFIEGKNLGSLQKWELLRDRASDSKFISIFTGRMEENNWYDMNFPETEVLLLLFTSTEYFLPQFLKSMKKLKFLLISNRGTEKATVQGLDVLSSLTQLKSVRLERLISPLSGKQSIQAVQNLEKLSLSLCEGFENVPMFNKLQDFNFDHSNNLEELPCSICNIPSILSLSITNCHQLQNLPDNLGKLSNLRVLRLSALPCLEQLPASIGELKQLEYLDISLCEGLKELPKEIGQLKKLKELDMRECSRLTTLPAAVSELTSLKLVTCDETIGKQWLGVKNCFIAELRVEIVEEYFSLDWLDV